MDEHELARRGKTLPEQHADRVGDELPIPRSHAAGSEYGELVSDLLATLAQTRAPVTVTEKDELRTLADATGEGSPMALAADGAWRQPHLTDGA